MQTLTALWPDDDVVRFRSSVCRWERKKRGSGELTFPKNILLWPNVQWQLKFNTFPLFCECVCVCALAPKTPFQGAFKLAEITKRSQREQQGLFGSQSVSWFCIVLLLSLSLFRLFSDVLQLAFCELKFQFIWFRSSQQFLRRHLFIVYLRLRFFDVSPQRVQSEPSFLSPLWL